MIIMWVTDQIMRRRYDTLDSRNPTDVAALRNAAAAATAQTGKQIFDTDPSRRLSLLFSSSCAIK